MERQHYRIGLCADTHFWQNGVSFVDANGSLQLQSNSDQLLSTLLAELEAAQVDLVLHLGDVTCGGGFFEMPREDFYAALDYVHGRFSQLSAPTYAVPGNHDCPPGGGDWSYFERLWGLSSGIGMTIDLPMARLVLLNAQGHQEDQIDEARPTDPAYGWVNETELLRLEEALASAGGRPVLLFCHQLLRPWISNHNEWAYFYGVKNAQAVLDIMARYSNVRAVFQAHAHRLDVHVAAVGARPCYFIVSPAIIEYPLAWLALELTPGRLQIQLRRLPIPELAAISLHSGVGQGWRSGLPQWADMAIELA
jgi:3',5'-cyclic AMP phosphodiesterase CpdA